MLPFSAATAHEDGLSAKREPPRPRLRESARKLGYSPRLSTPARLLTPGNNITSLSAASISCLLLVLVAALQFGFFMRFHQYFKPCLLPLSGTLDALVYVREIWLLVDDVAISGCYVQDRIRVKGRLRSDKPDTTFSPPQPLTEA